MERVQLAPDLSISRVLTGMWQVADLEREGGPLDLEAATAAMLPFARAGLTSFDMADHYGSAELIAGAFARRFGHEHPVELLTKWVPGPGPIGRAATRAAVERALARLQRERLDLLQFHTWTYYDPAWLDALGWLQELRDEGVIGSVGVTNFDAAHLRIALASGFEVVSNQVSYSLLDRRAAGELSALCAEQDVKLLAYGTVAGGLLTERWLGAPEAAGDELDTWSQMKYRRFIEAAGGWEPYQGLLRALKQVADRHGVGMANVATRWVLESPAVAGVVVGARLGQAAHVEENARLCDFSLDADSRALLETSAAELAPIPGDCGDEYRRPPFLTASGDLGHHIASFPVPFETRELDGGRTVALSGTRWEELAGYARAVRIGNRVHVSGTTASHRGAPVAAGDCEAQAHAAIDKIEGALISLGGTLEDVVRTRVFVRSIDDWEGAARAHGRRFGHVLPANTLVEARLVGDALVEVEAEAELAAAELA